MKGREMLAENVRRLVDPNDVERADRLEQQITQVHVFGLPILSFLF